MLIRSSVTIQYAVWVDRRGSIGFYTIASNSRYRVCGYRESKGLLLHLGALSDLYHDAKRLSSEDGLRK